MAERAHPDDPAFRDCWDFRLRRGVVPWVTCRRSPYRAALLYRYAWVGKHCRGRDVLDIPCGMGWGTSLLKGCRSLVGVDIAADAIDEARRRYGGGIIFRVGRMDQLDFPERAFDVVCCLEGIEHVPEETGRRFLGEAWRVLRPGGSLFLTSPRAGHGGHSGNPFHEREYRPEEMRGLLDGLFHVDEYFARDVDVLRVHYFRARKLDR
jgi:2-polyprenyl-3-methyl-5-hydroxy-6-metoxy-1,4-benzoquinol methylase